MTRLLLSIACVLVLASPATVMAQSPPATTPAAPAAAPAPPAAQNEYVPVSELPPVEQMPAGPLVLGAYGFIWAAVLIYVFSLARRLSAVQKDLDALQHRARR